VIQGIDCLEYTALSPSEKHGLKQEGLCSAFTSERGVLPGSMFILFFIIMKLYYYHAIQCLTQTQSLLLTDKSHTAAVAWRESFDYRCSLYRRPISSLVLVSAEYTNFGRDSLPC